MPVLHIVECLGYSHASQLVAGAYFPHTRRAALRYLLDRDTIATTCSRARLPWCAKMSLRCAVVRLVVAALFVCPDEHRTALLLGVATRVGADSALARATQSSHFDANVFRWVPEQQRRTLELM